MASSRLPRSGISAAALVAKAAGNSHACAVHVVAPAVRGLATGGRGARGHGWFLKYRDGLGERHLQGRWWDREIEDVKDWNQQVFDLGSSFCYMDIVLKENERENSNVPKRLVVELASAALPTTTKNFTLLCQDNKNNNSEASSADDTYSYVSTKVHRIEKDVGFCMGDVTDQQGKGGSCHPDINPYGFFPFEPLVLSHLRGIVTMMAPGVDRVDSRFILCTKDAPQLDGRNVGFGRLTPESLEILDNWQNNIYTKGGRPTTDIVIQQCGPLEVAGHDQAAA